MRISGRRLIVAIGMAVGGLLAAPAGRTEQTLRIELAETVAPTPSEAGMTVTEGRIAFTAHFGEVEFTWSAIPKVIGPDGFTVTLAARGRLDAKQGESQSPPMATVFYGTGFTTEPDLAQAEIQLTPGEESRKTQEVRVRPDPGLKDGDDFEITVGSSLGGIYRYRYRVGMGAAPGGQITAQLVDCPATIVISELPSLTCHLSIAGFRHNTADPVQVILPSAIDLGGNHGNGLQLANSAGALDVSRMDDPHLWSLTLFACPGQKGAGVNCHDTGAAPGPLSVPIVVRQEGAGEAQVMLAITAVAGRNSVLGKGGGEAVTSTSVAAAPGQIGARIDCPGTIFISALPSLNCHVVITGWRKDTADPVRVLFPESLDAFGNHANGLQLSGQGEEDHFEWDNDESHDWGFFVFACPGQSSTGADCFDSTATPGIKTARVVVEQDGLAAAELEFRIDAQPHP
ncbi:MAG: hypothetical protein IT548_12765 [Alphaproteobacteria bacterium]|nr:hypothetical protein [Alphaproteobacteria bacterium]